MAEMAVCFAIDQLLPLLTEEVNLLKGVHREFSDIKDELESIQALLKDADRRVATEGDNNSERVKIWVKQVTEAAFRIEDVVDEYRIYLAQQTHDQIRDSGCVTLLPKISQLFKTLKQRHRIASDIRDIKSFVHGIKERSERYGFQRSFEEGSSSSNGSQNAKWHDPRMAALYINEADVVGFEAPKKRLIDWIVKGRAERTVISVVGMGGQGKTTLAKKVFDSKEVVGHFDCHVWITVSQSYNVEKLLRDILLKLYKQKGEDLPKDIVQMDRGLLIDEVRNYLQQKRYVIVFDDVWSVHFWDDIEYVAIDDNNGSKILITTRNMDVAMSCKKSSLIEVHELQPLTEEPSLELFNKKAFRFDYNGCCPKELLEISSNIVKKCNGLPLAIVVIGGLLSTKDKNPFKWQRFSENLSLELKKDSHLFGIKEILSLSYNDLSYYLKSCLLYFGIYPEDYEVKSKRVIRQWIAEGFVKEERGKTLEEVAEGYLIDLIRRSLVQVSSVSSDGRAESCRVHDLIHLMILENSEDLSFCQHISDDGQSTLRRRIRRLSIANTSHDLMSSIESSHIRSLLFFTEDELPDSFVRRILTNCRLLKVLDFNHVGLLNVPENLGSLIHLKYLSFRYAKLGELPKSIGMLQNLETLDVRGTDVFELPKEISKLRKLRHLLGYRMSLIPLKDSIGSMTSLQTLCSVGLDGDGDVVVELITELGKLKQLRELGLVGVVREHEGTLSSLMNEMECLEKLDVVSKSISDEVVRLHLISPPPMLRYLRLCGKFKKLPEWIPELQNLVELKLEFSQLTNDPMLSLRNMQNLLSLSITCHAYEGVKLHFQSGWFQKLKELYINDSDNLSSIVIDKGALHCLKKLDLRHLHQLKTVPTGIQHLDKLEILNIRRLPKVFVQSIAPDGGKEHWIIKHVPLVNIDKIDKKLPWLKVRSKFLPL